MCELNQLGSDLKKWEGHYALEWFMALVWLVLFESVIFLQPLITVAVGIGLEESDRH